MVSPIIKLYTLEKNRLWYHQLCELWTTILRS